MALPTETTPVAKSLHTLKVIQQVANLHFTSAHGPSHRSAERLAVAVDSAMVTLALAGRPDPHGLRDRALALMIREAANEAG